MESGRTAAVLYCRPNVPALPPPSYQRKLQYQELRLVPSQRDELIQACSPIAAVSKLFHAKTPEQMSELATTVPDEWLMALQFAAKNGARMVVYRIEHLATTKERGSRLRALTELGVPLYVHVGWPFAYTVETLKSVADYSDAMYLARDRDRSSLIRSRMKTLSESGEVVMGRPPLCDCEHPRSSHDGDDGMCSVEGCPCTAYSRRAKDIQPTQPALA